MLRFVRNARDSGHSCILIAHNIHHVFQVVDRIAVMRHGKIVADDIDPKHTTVAEVEAVITGELVGLGALIGRHRSMGGQRTPSVAFSRRRAENLSGLSDWIGIGGGKWASDGDA